MNLIYYPNKSLETPCVEITEFNYNLVKIVQTMTSVMNAHNGLGLSANQVGLNIRLFLIKDARGTIQAICNPKLVGTDGMVTLHEGCLSAPGIYLPISRPDIVHFEFQTIEGEHRQRMAEGIEARAFLHELEHLDGKFYFDSVNRKLRKEALSKLRRG